MLLRSLGYELADGSATFDPAELLGGVTLARACPPVSDDGIAEIQHGNVIACGVPAGYFTDRYAEIGEVGDQAIAWDVHVVCA